MDVILLKDVDNLGLRGEVVTVARGYVRNYLKPRGLAVPATDALIAELKKRDVERAKHEARSADQAQSIAELLAKTVLRFERPAGPQGVLFGSITTTDIADELWRVRRVRVDRRKIHLGEPIKRVGRYDVRVEVYESVDVQVKTLVAPEGGELPDETELEPQELVEEENLYEDVEVDEEPADVIPVDDEPENQYEDYAAEWEDDGR
jgi:large subunit ribosomal protein L9